LRRSRFAAAGEFRAFTLPLDVLSPSHMSTAILDERPLTYEEERGKPMPGFNHGIIELRLGAQFLADRRFTSGIEVTLELPPGVPLTPDISVYPQQSIDLRHDIVRRTDPPLLAVEIVSPS